MHLLPPIQDDERAGYPSASEQAARLLDQIKRAQGLFKEVESYYKRVVESTPGAIPGWALVPADVRRSITDPVGALERLIETFSVSEFLQCCSPSVPELEKTWAKKKGQSATKARGEFGRCMDGLIIEKRNAPSLKQITNNTKQLLFTQQ
jgi:hypothetical protein